MTKKVLIPIADGTEEIEAIAIIDVLRRAGTEVTIASVTNNLQITTVNNIKVIADKLITQCTNDIYDLIVLPGGMPGAEHLRDCPELTDMLKAQQQNNRLYAAICASPVVILQHHGLLDNIKATCYPSRLDKLVKKQEGRVVVDGNCITSQAPGTAIEFALKLVELLFDKQKANQLADYLVI